VSWRVYPGQMILQRRPGINPPELLPAWDFYRCRTVLQDSPELWERVWEDPEAAFIGLQDAGLIGRDFPGRRRQLRYFERAYREGRPQRLEVDYFEEVAR
jgi:hypothetical protein